LKDGGGGGGGGGGGRHGEGWWVVGGGGGAWDVVAGGVGRGGTGGVWGVSGSGWRVVVEGVSFSTPGNQKWRSLLRRNTKPQQEGGILFPCSQQIPPKKEPRNGASTEYVPRYLEGKSLGGTNKSNPNPPGNEHENRGFLGGGEKKKGEEKTNLEETTQILPRLSRRKREGEVAGQKLRLST